ncbi:MAG: serine hydrolase [Gemmatimonadaceae bacterium]
MENRLGVTDWMRAARLALLHSGPDGVRVEPLARALGVTKGSFYWHFRDRADLLEALLAEWEAEASLLSDALGSPDPVTDLRKILLEVERRTHASERGEWPSDAAIFAWAAVDPAVAKRINRAEVIRMRLLRDLTGRPEMADLFYYAYQGLLHRRRRVPSAVADFTTLARLGLELLTGDSFAAVATPKAEKKAPATRKRRLAKRAGGALTLLVAALSIQGCTIYRILRWRDPLPNVQDRIFDQRVVRHAYVPFRFYASASPRTDLDTVMVRDTDGEMRRFDQYVAKHRIRAFLVIRNDTVLYERYNGGLTDAGRWSSFSVAKSITSALVGVALGWGAIRNLDDPITSYLPEFASNPAFNGITLRHLLGMKSGLAYTRADGGLLHNLLSSDAHFYYTTDRVRSLIDMRREEPPGAPWAYKDSDAELIGLVLARATGKTIAAQLEESIWRRIGTEHNATYILDHRGGVENVSSGFNATARDYARFGRLYLNDGEWNGTQIIPRDWVRQSTQLDTSRTEPEVTTWYRMQHQLYWWLPMHNWAAERDFYADGSRGQRIYVHAPTRTIIVQLAEDSDQDFPFRRIAHYLAGEPYEYPRSISRLVLKAARAYGADSARAMFRRMTAEMRTAPQRYVLNEAALLDVIETLREENRSDAADALLLLAEDTYPRSCEVKRARAARGHATPQQSAVPIEKQC